MITKTQLSFDSADIAESDIVGARVLSTGDTEITFTDVSGKKSLDVNVAALTASDIDIRDLSALQDNVAISDGTDTLAINGDGSINAVVTATDLDIRDLTAATDSVSSWTHDGTGNAIGSTAGALDVHIASGIEINVEDDKANTAIENTQETVNTTSSDLLSGSQLAARRFYFLQNLGNQAVYVGKPGVTTANGFKLPKNTTAEFRLGPALALHAVTASGTADCRIMEFS